MEKPDLSFFPVAPGVYLYKDSAGRILYVGKAKRLRHRIASYFRDESSLSPKTRTMLRASSGIDILRTSTEKEALLLEASLIKKHRPRYNIVLRDDKEYLLFRIGNAHPYPRIEIVRRSRHPDKGRHARFFGPFASASAARETWKLIHKYFPLRRCRDVAFANRTRPCLYYDMGQCLAPCVLSVTREDYQSLLNKTILLLSGRSRELVHKLREEMALAAAELRFEQAARLRDQIKTVEYTLERQSVVLPETRTLDIVGVAQVPEGLALGIVFVRDGRLLDGRNYFWPGLTVEDTPELIRGFLTQYYLNRREFEESIPPRIVIPWLLASSSDGLFNASRVAEKPSFHENAQEDGMAPLETALAEIRGSPVHITEPRSRDEDALSVMAASNAREAIKNTIHPPLAGVLAKYLGMDRPARRIEAVDISHTAGRQVRAGLVVFEDENPLPEAFRIYALDDALTEDRAEAGDDYAALAAWAVRRAAAGEPWPDLLLVDGGKGQLAAVQRVFGEKGTGNSFFMASIAKARTEANLPDRRAGNVSDRIFVPGRSNPLNMPPGSRELLFLQRIRDTAHDYVINRHRKARAAVTLAGELTRLPGVGPETARRLFAHFGSLAAMAAAGENSLSEVPGIGRAKAKSIAGRLAALMESEPARAGE
ncbi:MAG: excinuclease ABC subunit UvrC [Desulfovibrio sp.]|jgi:excinuclease ABC subunit C|nr:excinuclease ABC subunit UvrC [Desulfovibrio sp.]